MAGKSLFIAVLFLFSYSAFAGEYVKATDVWSKVSDINYDTNWDGVTNLDDGKPCTLSFYELDGKLWIDISVEKTDGDYETAVELWSKPNDSYYKTSSQAGVNFERNLSRGGTLEVGVVHSTDYEGDPVAIVKLKKFGKTATCIVPDEEIREE